MTRLTVPDEVTFATFTVTTSTSAFPITFSLFAKADLTVLVDDVALDQSAFSFSGTLLDGGGYDGGTVTLNTAVDDVTVRIERNIAPVRTSNFAPSSSTPVGNVDQALNRLTGVQQDHARRIGDVEDEIEGAVDAAAALDAFLESGTGGTVASGADVTFLPQTSTPALRAMQTKLREQAISPADSADLTDALRLTDAIRAAQNGAGHRVFIPAGEYNADIAPLDISEEMRGKPISIFGAGSGEPFVAQGLQEGTRLIGVDATSPVVDLKHKVPQQGSGSIDFRKFFIRGTKNAGVPVFRSEGLQGLNFIAELGILQSGVGDGVHLGNVTTSTFENSHVLGASWATGGDIARTGTGVSMVLDQDCGLGRIDKITSRGFDKAYSMAVTGPYRALGYTASLCEVSYCANGFEIGTYTEAFHLESPYVEGCYGYAIKTSGKSTLITNPYIVLDFTTGVDCRGTGGVMLGGYIGLKADGGTAIAIDATAVGTSIWGTRIIWGSAGLGGAATGVHIKAASNPQVNALVTFNPEGVWAGGTKVLDESTSSGHGTTGSGVFGILTRESGGRANIPCLSRGSVNLHYDTDILVAADINGSGTLALSTASVQELFLSATTTTIVRFSAPNLPDKTGTLIVSNGYARIDPGTYIRGISVPLILAAGERAAIQYQTIPGANGVIFITNVQREKTQLYTVATLPAAATAGAGYPAYVTDATAPTWGAAVVGGGAVPTSVRSTGAAWNVG